MSLLAPLLLTQAVDLRKSGAVINVSTSPAIAASAVLADAETR
ncbi:hypothetical protein APASM_1391 [Actinosynnema pretiosum subsp. pretiosum]|nr:hypothetical protein APASM_1391 [Actinosynnema pretiosum subsp. pretiosum]